ncbi:MAG: triose-phosphate isomerase family protein [Pseudolysinimonas sp.]|uniref:triose-phosphate isomerase family protein n=1 Tax=Pseudolysinimonas sp. TaxID=2680009 RepID=UPI003264D8E9
MTTPLVVGVSFKMYFSHARARQWFAEVASSLGGHPALATGRVELFVLPTYLQIADAVEALSNTPIRVGAQDVAATDEGSFTGEVSAAELAEIGATIAEVGHLERRALYGETDDIVAAKTAAALRAGLTPLICVGGSERDDDDAGRAAVEQLERALAAAPTGRVLVAYEPGWAIGAAQPAPASHIAAVSGALRASLSESERAGSAVLYGGSAGPGLLTELNGAVDGLFLGRFAHDPAQLARVVDDADALTRQP